MSPRLRVDRRLIRAAGGSVRHLLVDIAAPEAPPRAGRAPVNVALVLDRSGSMAHEKLALARQAVEHALRLLTPQDRFTLVAFDDVVEVVVASIPASAEARRLALDALAGIGARGSTNLAGGWEMGCQQVLAHLSGEAIGRCLLLTDGQANVGESDAEALARLTGAMRERGVATSTFGIGADFDERTLQRMAEGGRGHFYYVETPQAIADRLTSELGESLDIVARDAAVVLRTPAGAEATPLGAFRVDAAGQVTRIEIGDLTSGQELQLVVRVTFPAGAEADTHVIGVSLAARDHALGEASADVTCTYAGHPENDAQARDRAVDLATARVYAALARQHALDLNRQRDFAGARRLLERVARKIASYAGTDPQLNRIVAELRRDAGAFGADMDLVQAKQRRFAAYSVQYSRTSDGKAQKR